MDHWHWESGTGSVLGEELILDVTGVKCVFFAGAESRATTSNSEASGVPFGHLEYSFAPTSPSPAPGGHGPCTPVGPSRFLFPLERSPFFFLLLFWELNFFSKSKKLSLNSDEILALVLISV